MTDKPFAGCFDVLESLIEDGTLDRFNDLADQRAYPHRMGLTVYQDGTFTIQRELDAAYEMGSVPDFVTFIPLKVLLPAIAAATK